MSEKLILKLAGGLAGLVGPQIAMYSYYLFGYNQLEYSVFIDRLLYSTLFAPVLSVCVIVNLLFFFIFIWLDKDEGAKGVLFTTILYAFVIVAMRIF